MRSEMSLLHDFLSRTASGRPDQTALIAGERRVSFGALDRESDALAAGLQAAGVERGDRCAVIMDNCPELVVSLFGILKAGAVFTVLSPTLKEIKIAAILNDCTAKAVIASPQPATAPVKIGRNDPCFCGSGKKYKKCHGA